jgi:hypothetical protein
LVTLAQEIDAITSASRDMAPGQRVRAEISQFPAVRAVQSQSTADCLTMKQGLATIEDAHLAQVMVQTQSGRVVSEVALSANARAIQPSLADFLK